MQLRGIKRAVNSTGAEAIFQAGPTGKQMQIPRFQAKYRKVGRPLSGTLPGLSGGCPTRVRAGCAPKHDLQ